METPLVSARIPRTTKERAAAILSEMGATTTDLIKAAFDYVIETKKLPMASQADAQHTQNDWSDFLKRTTFKVPWSDDVDYRHIIEEGRRRDYEALT